MEKKSHHQLKQIESLFATPFTRSTKSPEVAIIESQRDFNCDVHGGRRGSSGSVSSVKRDSVGSLQNGENNNVRGTSVPPAPVTRNVTPNRRGSIATAPFSGSTYNINGTVRLRKKESIDRDMTPNRDSFIGSGNTLRRQTESMDRDVTPISNGIGGGNGVQRRQSFAGNRKVTGDAAR